MALSPAQLRVELRRAGIATAAVDAAWPQWWSSEAESSLSATAELSFTVARRLGLSPEDLLDGAATFVWRDETKYKRLTATATTEEAALSSFGCAVARAALAGVPGANPPIFSALYIRQSILTNAPFVDAGALLSFAWGVGIPVLWLRVFPLEQKRMHAMSVGLRGRAVILLAREASYLAPMAFTLAHEIAHVMLGHLAGATAVVDFEDPLRLPELDDSEEIHADRFALQLLTGQTEPQVLTDADDFTATQLAAAVKEQGPPLGIDPGVLAMCAGHSTQRQWQKVYGALKMIPPGRTNVQRNVNNIAERQIDWSLMTVDSADYLHQILGLAENNV